MNQKRQKKMLRQSKEQSSGSWFDIESCKIVNLYDSGVPGTQCMVVTHPGCSTPIAQVWYRFGIRLDEIAIIDSHTHRDLHRRGLRTKIQKELFRWYPKINSIITQLGTDSGYSWMMKVGYKEHKERYLYCTRSAFNKYLTGLK